MIEIVFNESACGSLKIAQGYGSGHTVSVPIGCIVHRPNGEELQPDRHTIQKMLEETRQQKQQQTEKAVPLGGKPEDVYALDLSLSTGDISGDLFGEERVENLCQLLVTFPDGRNWVQQCLSNSARNLNAVLERTAKGEEIRVWYSNAPDDLCGLCWFLAELERIPHGSVWLIKMPEWVPQQDGRFIVIHTGWGEVVPEEWHQYITLQKPAPEALFHAAAMEWRDLQKANTPLRASVNGRLYSVPENFYDSFILETIAQFPDKFNESAAIGRMIGKYQIKISDGWVAHRIDSMIKSGLLETVTPADENGPGYRRVLRKTARLTDPKG